MSETCRIARGRGFHACRLQNGSVAIYGSGETIDSCERLKLVREIPVDPHSPPPNSFTLAACKEPGHICADIVMWKSVGGVYRLAKSANAVVIRAADGPIEIPIEVCRENRVLALADGESLGIGKTYEAATLDAIHQMDIPTPSNPDVAVTVQVTEQGYTFHGFIADHFYVKVKVK